MAQTSMKAELTSGKLPPHTGAADLPVESLKTIVGVDTGPVFAGKITVGQSLLDVIFRLFSGLFQLHGTQFLHHGFGFLPSSLLAFPGLDRLERFSHQLHLGARRDSEHIAVKVDGTALVLGFEEYFPKSLTAYQGTCHLPPV